MILCLQTNNPPHPKQCEAYQVSVLWERGGRGRGRKRETERERRCVREHFEYQTRRMYDKSVTIVPSGALMEWKGFHLYQWCIVAYIIYIPLHTIYYKLVFATYCHYILYISYTLYYTYIAPPNDCHYILYIIWIILPIYHTHTPKWLSLYTVYFIHIILYISHIHTSKWLSLYTVYIIHIILHIYHPPQMTALTTARFICLIYCSMCFKFLKNYSEKSEKHF